jgi:outer membrane protein
MKYLLFVFGCSIHLICNAQQKFSLQDCIRYAEEHNISLQQNAIQIKNLDVQQQQIANNALPSINAGFSNGASLGRSVDPTSNSFINQAYYYNGLNLNANILVFGWFANQYQKQANTLDILAAKSQYKQLANDIALNIAAGYLRVLLAKEQIKINTIQLEANQEQLKYTSIRVQEGALPKLSEAQLQAQISSDSATLLNSIVDEKTSLLDLKAFLNMDMSMPFDIEVPDVSAQILSLFNYPEAADIFQMAIQKRPAIEANTYKIQSAKKQIDIAKANGKPRFSLGANFGTNYASTVQEVTGVQYAGETEIGSIKIADSMVPILRPNYIYTTARVPYFKQYDNNFRSTISADISIPILNGFANKLNVARAELNVKSAELSMDAEKNILKQNVYKAYNDAMNAMQKWNAANSNTNASKIALDFAVKRYNAGLLSVLEYTTQQSNLARASTSALLTKYDLIFKMKILDFYMGKEVKL